MRVLLAARWAVIATILTLVAAACGTSSVALNDDEAAAETVSSTTSSSSTSSSTTTTSSTTSSTTTSTSSTTSTTTSSTSTSSTTTTAAPAAPSGDLLRDEDGVPLNGQTDGILITNTGWIVPIIATTADGWQVWTPCGRTADLTEGRVVASADFVIDAGHGGSSEPGAVGPGGLREADLNLQVALKIRDALVGSGYSVIMTRQTDIRIPIVTRGEIAQALDPIANISVHFNAGTDAGSVDPGTEMWHQIESSESKRLAGLMYEEVVATLDGHDIDWVSLSDAGAMSRPNQSGGDYYGVLRRPGPVTSVLAEFGYISNRAEEDLYSDPAIQQGLAAATLRAVDRLVDTSDAGSGFTTDPIFRGYGPSGAGRTDDCVDPKLQ